MFGFLRLFLILFVVMTVLYLAITIFARSLARERLEKRWDTGPRTEDRDTFIRLGMERYEKSARHKLLLGVYILPMVVIAILIYALNFS